MNTGLFRKQATAAYLKSETRGTIVQVAPPTLSLFFVAVTALFLAGVGMALFARIQIPLEGRGAMHSSERPTTLRAQRSGRVALLGKARGDLVKKDETIASLEAESDVVALASCQRDLSIVRTDMGALDERAGAGTAGIDLLLTMQRSRAHDRRAMLEVRCADLERAIANAKVGAPMDGVVDRIEVVPGDSVREGDVVAAVARPGAKLIGSFQVPETRRAELAVGGVVRFVFDAFPAERYGTGRGRIARLVYAADGSRGVTHDKTKDAAESIVVEMEIDELPRGVSRAEAGMTFSGYVETERRRLGSFLWPSTSK